MYLNLCNRFLMMLKQLISSTKAAQILYVFFALTLVYHLLVIVGIIPLDMAWGGNLKTTREMYLFESISIGINLLIIFLVAVRTNKINMAISPKILRVLFVLLALLFLLNTLGNVFAKNILESIIFTPITGISALLFIRLAMND